MRQFFHIDHKSNWVLNFRSTAFTVITQFYITSSSSTYAQFDFNIFLFVALCIGNKIEVTCWVFKAIISWNVLIMKKKSEHKGFVLSYFLGRAFLAEKKTLHTSFRLMIKKSVGRIFQTSYHFFCKIMVVNFCIRHGSNFIPMMS